MSMSSKIAPADRLFRKGWYQIAFLAAGVIVYQVLVYSLIVDEPDGGLGEGLRVAPLLVVGGCVFGRSPRGRLLLAATAGLGVLGLLLWRSVGASPALFYPIPYLAVYLFLLFLFGRTLKPGREPLVTRIATHVQGELPAYMVDYTRRVTWAWCVFFAGMAVTSMLLFVLAPLPI